MTSLHAVLDAFTARDLAAAIEHFCVDATYRELRRAPIVGREAIAAHFAAFASSGVAWTLLVDDVIADGRRACVVYRFRMGEGEAGVLRERAGCAVVRLDGGGLIQEWREYEG